MTAPDVTPAALRSMGDALRQLNRECVACDAADCERCSESITAMLLLESAAARIEALTAERDALHRHVADLVLERDDLEEARDTALAQLALARPIAEACADLVRDVAQECCAPASANGSAERLAEDDETICGMPARWGILTAWTCSKHRRPHDKNEIGSKAMRKAMALLEADDCPVPAWIAGRK